MREQTKVMERQSQLILDQVTLMDKQNVLAKASNDIAARQGEIANNQLDLSVDQQRQSELLFVSNLQNISVVGVRVIKRSTTAEIWVEISNFSNHTACLVAKRLCVTGSLRVVTQEYAESDLIISDSNPQDVLSNGTSTHSIEVPWGDFLAVGIHGGHSSFLEVDLKAKCVDGSTLLVTSTWVLGEWDETGAISGSLFKLDRKRVLVDVPGNNVNNLIRFCQSVLQQQGILRSHAKIPADVKISERLFQQVFFDSMSADPQGRVSDDSRWIPWWDMELASQLLRTKLGL